MLVPLLVPSWTKEEKKVITSKMEALAKKEGQKLEKAWKSISSLQAGEPLWLYSHGGSGTFAGMDAETLAAFLVGKPSLMPEGPRLVVLKGCKTSSYATSVQELINAEKGYRKVVVAGFEGEASITTKTGEKKVRTKTTEKEANRLGALAGIKSYHQAKAQNRTVTKAEVEEVQKSTRNKALYQDVDFDANLGTFIVDDARNQRKNNRNQVKQEAAARNTTSAVQGSDGEEGLAMEEDIQPTEEGFAMEEEIQPSRDDDALMGEGTNQ